MNNNITKTKINKKRFFYAMIALPLLQFFIFYVGVNLNSILLAFRSYDYYTGVFSFVGLNNFRDVISDIAQKAFFKTAFINSFILYTTSLFIGLTFSILFAFYIHKKRFFSGFFKFVLFLPSIVSSLAMVVIYKYFVEIAVPDIALKLFGIEIQGLLSDSSTVFKTIIFFNLWTGFGVQLIMYASAMSQISDSIVESAKLDGVTALKELLFITIPLIWQTVVVYVAVGLATLFTNQMHLFSFYGRSAEYKLYTVGYYLYRTVAAPETTIAQYPGLSAFGILLTIISAPATLLVKKALEKFGPRTD